MDPQVAGATFADYGRCAFCSSICQFCFLDHFLAVLVVPGRRESVLKSTEVGASQVARLHDLAEVEVVVD